MSRTPSPQRGQKEIASVLLAACEEALAEMEECIDARGRPSDPPAARVIAQVRKAIDLAYEQGVQP